MSTTAPAKPVLCYFATCMEPELQTWSEALRILQQHKQTESVQSVVCPIRDADDWFLLTFYVWNHAVSGPVPDVFVRDWHMETTPHGPRRKCASSGSPYSNHRAAASASPPRVSSSHHQQVQHASVLVCLDRITSPAQSGHGMSLNLSNPDGSSCQLSAEPVPWGDTWESRHPLAEWRIKWLEPLRRCVEPHLEHLEREYVRSVQSAETADVVLPVEADDAQVQS